MKHLAPASPSLSARIGFVLTILLALLSMGLGLHGTLDFSRQGYSAVFRAGIVFIALAGCIRLVWHARFGKPGQDPKPQAARPWLAGFLAVLVLSMASVLIVDPYSQFGLRPFPRTVVPISPKVVAYEKLTAAPPIVVLGSSRALLISPTYMQEKLGLPAFNFAVQGASTENLLIFSRFMLAHGPLPEVLFVEVAPPLDRGTEAVMERTPPALFPYTPVNLAFLTVRKDFFSLFSIHSLSDATFLLLRLAWLGPEVDAKFDAAGLITNMDLRTDQETLSKNAGTIDLPHCSSLDPTGLQNIRDLIDLASQHHSAIVFYQSPRHPLLYERMLADPGYLACQQAFERAMQAFESAHPNVFFLEYLQLEAVNRLGLPGFYDPQHLTYAGSNLVIDAALPTLQEALDWARAQRPER